MDDDLAAIRNKMFEAQAIAFEEPNYYGVINALDHSFLERIFNSATRSGSG